MTLTYEEYKLESTAARIRAQADQAHANGDHREGDRLNLLAECLWPVDPAQRVVDRMEHQEIASRHKQWLS